MARRTFIKPLMLVLAAALAWTGLCFALGYRLPQPDRHPDWRHFPYLSNPRLVVEEIPDFAERYGHRFPFVLARQEGERWYFEEVYRTNLRNIRSLGYCTTGNDFEGLSFRVTSGGNDVGRSGVSPSQFGFHQEGYQYLQVKLGTEVGGIKEPFRDSSNAMVTFYQYNNPNTTRDTLYLHRWDTDWRIVYR